MSAAGKVRYTGSTNGQFTNNQEYPVLGFVGLTGLDVGAVTVDDNGEITSTNSLAASSWDVVELYAPTRVI